MKKNWFVGFIICLILCICFFIGICILAGVLIITAPISSDVKNEPIQKLATAEAYSIIEVAKREYTESLFDYALKTSGNVSELKLSSGKKFNSGTWNINLQTGEVALKDVVIDNYICNTDSNYKVMCLPK